MQNKFPLMKAFLVLVTAAFFCAQAQAQLPKVYVTSNIVGNTTWTSNKIWYLRNKIYVTNGATLTIQPGTVIVGDTTTKGCLIITRGAKIYAVGTPCQPIVFTSSKAKGRRVRGDWGGVILLGYAPTNSPGDTNHIEGIEPNPNTLYGGNLNPKCGGGNCPDIADNSGTMKYVRIEFAGVALSPNNEINGLTFGGVGSGTTIDHIQVSYSNDDSYEWFGGTVNVKYLIAFRGIDDDFDTDQGYSGKNQFLIGLRDPKVADISGSKGFESDNDANSSTNLPQTRAVYSNVTVDAGGDTTANAFYVAGAHIRRNSHIYILNSIIMGYPTGVLIDGASTEANVLADTLVQNNIISATRTANWIDTTPSNQAVEDLLRNQSASTNRFYKTNSTTGTKGVGLADPYNLTAPKLYPKTNTPPTYGAKFAKYAVLNDAFFTKTSYVGAIEDAAHDWTTTGWVNWNPVNTDYTNGVPNNCTPGIAEEEVKPAAPLADVKLSPNPSSGSFNIEAKGFANNIVNIKVADLNTGKIYFIGKANNNTTTRINVRVPNGNYAVEFTDGKNVVTKKVTILN